MSNAQGLSDAEKSRFESISVELRFSGKSILKSVNNFVTVTCS